MTTTITSAVTVFFIIVGVWAADLVCYHPKTDLDPLSPISLTTDWN
jgi:hypothetical protein